MESPQSHTTQTEHETALTPLEALQREHDNLAEVVATETLSPRDTEAFKALVAQNREAMMGVIAANAHKGSIDADPDTTVPQVRDKSPMAVHSTGWQDTDR